MFVARNNLGQERFANDAGIAIGPILFVIAVLGILAAAIAAGSGSFTAGSAAEGNRTKAAAIIEIGQNLKIGFDRITSSSGIAFEDVDIDVAQTSGAEDLFSPLGGGIMQPSVTMSADPVNDIWYYPRGSIPAIGTGGSNTSQLAVLNVTEAVCREINNKAIGFATTATLPAGDVGVWEVNTDVADIAGGNWPTSLNAKPTGCINNTNATTAGYYFYQVIGIR